MSKPAIPDAVILALHRKCGTWGYCNNCPMITFYKGKGSVPGGCDRGCQKAADAAARRILRAYRARQGRKEKK